MNLRQALTAFALLSIPYLSIALELPTPPAGFSWREAPLVKAAFLVPDGWHFRAAQQGSTNGYFITKEDIGIAGSFTTGTSINVIRGIPEKAGLDPSRHAQEYIITAATEGQIQRKPWAHNMGPFRSFGVVTRHDDPEEGDYVTHHLAIGNDSTGTIYIVIFEAPEADWQSAWSVGEQILGRLYIDSDI